MIKKAQIEHYTGEFPTVSISKPWKPLTITKEDKELSNPLAEVYTILDMIAFPISRSSKNPTDQQISEVLEAATGHQFNVKPNINKLDVKEKKKLRETYKHLKNALAKTKELIITHFGDTHFPPGVMKELQKLENEVGIFDENVTDKDYRQTVQKLLFDFLKGTTTFATKALPWGAYRCAIAKIVFTYFYIYFHQQDTLKEKTEEFENILFPERLHATTSHDHWKNREISTDGGKITINEVARAKDIHRIALKLMSHSQTTYNENVRDRMGIRMEVDIEHVADVVQYIVQRLRKSKKEIKELQFDSKNVLFSDDPKDSSTKMLQVNLDINMLHGLGIDHINERTPDDHFTDLRIYGQIGSEEQRGKRESFEIQIVPVGNTNELGLSHHTIWEKLGSFKALIRLFGRVPASWVEEFINDAYAASTTDDQVTEFVLSASKKDSLKKVSAPEGNQHRINYERLKKEAIRRRFLNHTVRLVDGKITTVKEINRLGELGTLPNGMETAYAILQHPTEPTKAIIRSDVEQVIKGKGPNPFKDIPPCSIFIIGEDGGVTVEHHH